MAGRGNVGPFQELDNQKESVSVRFYLPLFIIMISTSQFNSQFTLHELRQVNINIANKTFMNSRSFIGLKYVHDNH